MIDYRAYKVDKPYPEVIVQEKDEHDAKLLLDDYASRGSEYTAIAQYVYAHILAEEKDIQDTFLGIAIVEMTHLDMLGEAILKLGEDPEFRSGKDRAWNSEYVPYGSSTEDRIKLAIKGEQDAIRQYERHVRLLHNRTLKRLLERIIMDEKLHITIFHELLRKYY